MIALPLGCKDKDTKQRNSTMGTESGVDASVARSRESARQDGLHIVTDPLQHPERPHQPSSSSSSSDDSSQSSAHPLQPPSSHIATPLPFPPGVMQSQGGNSNPRRHTKPALYSEHTLRTRYNQPNHAQAIAWLYDYDGGPEDDDWLHVPGIERKQGILSTVVSCCKISVRGLVNMVALGLLASTLLMLFAGYPILHHFLTTTADRKASGFFGIGGTNGTGQVPLLPKLFSLIDRDTPSDAHKWTNPVDKANYHLVFSDEFETEGRTFWPGDDPFWEAVDLHYWVTGDYEWYSPEAINTTGGYLNVWMQEKETHNLNFQSGMLQSWNKFCFQGGYIESSVILPGSHSDEGFWPAVWLLGNLGRAGYAGTTQGMWPYSYSQCDVGTLANQTNPEKTGPYAALHAHGMFSDTVDNKISFLEGQRVSACTCPGADHPGPSHDVGRASPEIDLFEVQVSGGHGKASQSFQIAPFDANYSWSQAPDVAVLHSPETTFNTYTGSVYQEAVSGVTRIPDSAYAHSPDSTPATIGVQYDPDWAGDGSGSITWFLNGQPTWTLSGAALGPNKFTEIGQRLVPREPMSIVVNLALSDGFQKIKWNQLTFPAVMKLDYVRVYQKDGQKDRISCDPKDHPTAKYIRDHLDVYSNMNYTVFPQDKYGQVSLCFGRNALTRLGW